MNLPPSITSRLTDMSWPLVEMTLTLQSDISAPRESINKDAGLFRGDILTPAPDTKIWLASVTRHVNGEPNNLKKVYCAIKFHSKYATVYPEQPLH